MQPTPEQLTRAAELVPKVAEIVGIRAYRDEAGDVLLTLGGASLVDPPEFVGLLDPRAFQATVLALPPSLIIAAVGGCRPGDEAFLLKRALTPAGMLAFYEALTTHERDYLRDTDS